MTNKIILFGFALLLALHPIKTTAQVLETEDARALKPGQFEVGGGFEYQTSKEGKESALPLAIEYGISKKLTILVEPVGFTSIRPKIGLGTSGGGDLEMTLFYQLFPETKGMPSISISAEVKLPTSHDSLIGTGKTDFAPYLIASKTTGKFFTSANLSYTFLGKPAGVQVNNLLGYALGTVFSANARNILFGEIYGNTSAFGGADAPEGSTGGTTNGKTTEISGGELVMAIMQIKLCFSLLE